ncbi:MAG: alpha/beta fold hydrolase [Acidobacteriota bacterium]
MRRTLLLLPGLLGDASSLWQQVEDLGRDHDAIAVDYLDTPESAPQLDALLRRLDEREARRAVLVGQTLGGYLAQAFAEAHPDRVEALVLVHAGLPDPALGKRIRRDLILPRLLPWPALRWYLHRALRKMIAGLEASGDVDAAQAQVVAQHFRRRFAELLDKPRVLARYGLMANLHEAGLVPKGMADRVLILHSEGNVFARQLGRMKEIYPGAPAHAMGRRHNISLLIRPAESHRLIRGFLEHLG